MKKIKGANQNVLIWVIVALVLFAAANNQSVTDIFGNLFKSKSTTGSSASTAASQEPTGFCGSDKLADIQVRYRNGASITALDYRAVTLSLVDVKTNQVIASYTPNSDGTYAATANVLECGKKYQVVVLNRANAVAATSDVKLVDDSIIKFDVVGANSSQIAGNMYSLAFANETNTGTAFATGSQDFTTITNNALGTGDSITVRFDAKSVNSSAQFGSIERLVETNTGAVGRAFICASGDPAIYNKDDLSVSAPFVIGRSAILPKYCSNAAPANAGTGQVAFEIDAIKSSAGTASGTYFVKASAGNPGDTQNVRFIYGDNSYYQGSDGSLKAGTNNDANADTGDINRFMTIDIT